MPCEERSRLFERYATVVHAYSSAVKDAVHLTGVEFDKARTRLEELRKLSQDALNDVERHVSTHGCGVRKPPASELSKTPSEAELRAFLGLVKRS